MDFLRIKQYLTRFFHVYFLTLPGWYRDKKLAILRDLFVGSAQFLNDIGEEYWMDFGTLLGYYRERDIIPHDIDVDFAMHEKSYRNVLSKKHLLPKGFSFYDTSHRHRGPKLYLNYKGFDADIYFYEDLGDSVRSYENTKWPNEKREIPKALIYPLKSVNLFDKKISVPVLIEEYLRYIYGYLGSNGRRNLKTGFWEK